MSAREVYTLHDAKDVITDEISALEEQQEKARSMTAACKLQDRVITLMNLLEFVERELKRQKARADL